MSKPALPEDMTLRDHFAAQALPAVIAATAKGKHTPGLGLEGATIEEGIAHDVYKMADAMMKMRSY